MTVSTFLTIIRDSKIVYTMAVTLVGTMDTFKGFLIQARDPATPPPSTPVLLGHFITGSDGEQTLDCDPMGVLHEVSIFLDLLCVQCVTGLKMIVVYM